MNILYFIRYRNPHTMHRRKNTIIPLKTRWKLGIHELTNVIFSCSALCAELPTEISVNSTQMAADSLQAPPSNFEAILILHYQKRNPNTTRNSAKKNNPSDSQALGKGMTGE